MVVVAENIAENNHNHITLIIKNKNSGNDIGNYNVTNNDDNVVGAGDCNDIIQIELLGLLSESFESPLQSTLGIGNNKSNNALDNNIDATTSSTNYSPNDTNTKDTTSDDEDEVVECISLHNFTGTLRILRKKREQQKRKGTSEKRKVTKMESIGYGYSPTAATSRFDTNDEDTTNADDSTINVHDSTTTPQDNDDDTRHHPSHTVVREVHPLTNDNSNSNNDNNNNDSEDEDEDGITMNPSLPLASLPSLRPISSSSSTNNYSKTRSDILFDIRNRLISSATIPAPLIPPSQQHQPSQRNNTGISKDDILYPTPFHELCAQSSIESYQVVQDCIAVSGNDVNVIARMYDNYQRLPIHIIGMNTALISTQQGRTIATQVVQLLLQAHPYSMTATDEYHYRMPFVSHIEDWLYYSSFYDPLTTNTTTNSTNNSAMNGIINNINSSLGMTATNSMQQTADATTATSVATATNGMRGRADSGSTGLLSSASCRIQPLAQKIKSSILSTKDRMTMMDQREASTSQISWMVSADTYDDDNNNDHDDSNNDRDDSSNTNSTLNINNKNKRGMKKQQRESSLNYFMSSELYNLSTMTFPSNAIVMWDEIEWCFTMLSIAMDLLSKLNCIYNNNNNPNNVQSNKRMTTAASTNTATATTAIDSSSITDHDHRSVLAKHVIKVFPNIIKVILLMDDTVRRQRILQLSIIRRILCCHESVGPWLTSMLRKNSKSSCAVDYLQLISNLTLSDYTGASIHRNSINSNQRNKNGTSPSEQDQILQQDNDDDDATSTYITNSNNKDNVKFRQNQRAVLLAIKRTNGMIASLAILNKRERERASRTAVVQYILSKSLTRSFLVGIVLMDFILHITLMEAFRAQVFVLDNNDEKRSFLGKVPLSVAVFICSHYIIRKGCEAVSLLSLSVKCFRAHFTNVWTGFDVVTISAVVIAMVWNDQHPHEYRGGWNTLITGLLWIRVLGYLKVVNQQMATFVTALTEILKDLRFFQVVLVVCIFMFGDMMQIAVTSKDNGTFCENHINSDSSVVQDFCSGSRGVAVLRAYSLLLGEFSVEDYRETVGLTYLFVVFTLFGVVILLNVLIAVVSDSYERSKTGSDILFGTARLEFVAQHEALEEFLRPGTNPLKGIKLVMRRNSVRVLGRLFRWVVLLSLIMTAMVAEMFLVSRLIFLVQTDTQGVVYIITVSTLGTILAIALWIVSRFAFEGIIRSCAPAPVSRGFDYSATYTNKFVERLSGFMFGQRRDPFASDESDGNFNDEWISRAAYMEKVFERSLQKAKNELTSEIRELEQRLYDFKTPSLAIA